MPSGRAAARSGFPARTDLGDREFEGTGGSAESTQALRRGEQFAAIGRDEIRDRQGADHPPVVVENGHPRHVRRSDRFESGVKMAVDRDNRCTGVGQGADVGPVVCACASSATSTVPSNLPETSTTGAPPMPASRLRSMASLTASKMAGRAAGGPCPAGRDRGQRGSPAEMRRASVSARLRIWLR